MTIRGRVVPYFMNAGDLGGFPVKYAKCVVDEKKGLFEVTWIGYYFSWDGPRENLVKQYRIMGPYTRERLESSIEKWMEEERQISHRVDFQYDDIEEGTAIPYYLSKKLDKTNWRSKVKARYSDGRIQNNHFQGVINEALTNATANDKMGMICSMDADNFNEMSFAALTTEVHEIFQGNQYYIFLPPVENSSEWTLRLDTEPMKVPVTNWWIEVAPYYPVIDDYTKGYFIDEFGQKQPAHRVNMDEEYFDWDTNKNQFFIRIYKKVNNRFEYVCTANSGTVPSFAAPVESYIASSLGIQWNTDALKITLQNSALDLLDNYETKIPADALEMPKQSGLFLGTDESAMFVYLHKDKIVGRFFALGAPTEFGFNIPIEEIMDSKGYITGKKIDAYYKKVKRELQQSYDTIATKVGVDREIYDSWEDNIPQVSENSLGKSLTNLRLSLQYGFLGIEVGRDNTPKVSEDEGKKNLLLYGLKAMLVLRMPSVKEQIKADTKEYTTSLTPKKRPQFKQSRIYIWGNDKITYLYPRGNATSGKRYHFVRGHVRRIGPKRTTNVSPHYRGDLSMGISNPELFFGKADATGGYSRACIKWLESIEAQLGRRIRHAENGGEYRIPLANGRYYKVDGYDELTNTIYEFHGDVWHGNPKVFDDDDCPHPHDKTVTAKELYDATIARDEFLRGAYNLVTIWESDWNENFVSEN